MLERQIKTKEFLRGYGIFFGIILSFMLILALFGKLAAGRWERGLRQSVATVLDEKQAGAWRLGAAVRIKTPLAMGAAAYRATRVEDGADAFAVILRVQTLFGPLPAVFVQTGEEPAAFIGFASVHGRVAVLLDSFAASPRISYWRRKIKSILEASEAEAAR